MLRLIFTYAIFFISISIKANPTFVNNNPCHKLDWIHDDSRTQGGEWVWFPGKAMADSLEKSYQLSEGLALKRLNQECAHIPLETKFHERCDHNDKGIYVSFVRASVKAAHCKAVNETTEESKINKELSEQLSKYEHEQEDFEIKMKSAEVEKTMGTFDLIKHGALLWNLGEKEKAVEAYIKVSKLDPVKHKTIGFILHSMDSKELGFSIMAKQCEQDDFEACYLAGLVIKDENSTNQSLALPNLDRACKGKYAEACFSQGLILYALSKIEEARIPLINGCELKMPKCCTLVAQSYDQSSLKLRLEYWKKSCDLNDDIGCSELGMLQADEADINGAIVSFEKSCMQDYGPSCSYLGMMYMEKQRLTEAKVALEKGCQLKNELGCSIKKQYEKILNGKVK